MAEDLFEEENGNKKEEDSTEKSIDVFPDGDMVKKSFEGEQADADLEDDEAWIPLDDEELGISPIDDETREPSAYEEAETASDDEAWIPLDDKPSEDEEISDEELKELEEKYGIKDEGVDIDIDSEMEKSLEDKKTRVLEKDEEAEAPPWEEGVEIPAHGVTGSPKKRGALRIIGVLVIVAFVVIGLYVFLLSEHIFVKDEFKPKDAPHSFVSKKMEKMAGGDIVQKKGPEKMPATEHTAMEANTAPIINGEPQMNVRVGTAYSFIPKASDMNPDDNLTFFIANQPAWTTFDINTGSLTGMPSSENVGTYENIVILVSDGKATASLAGFAITVTGPIPSIAKEEEIQQEKIIGVPTFDEEKPPQQLTQITGLTPDTGRAEESQQGNIIDSPSLDGGENAQEQAIVRKEEVIKTEAGQYTLPDLTDLIRQSEFQDAALEYYKEVKSFPEAYALKLEVDCIDRSVQTAFQQGNFDRRMFILPKEINGKNCFVVFWGLYATKNEAIEALPSIPDFFGKQATKPKLVLIKQYL